MLKKWQREEITKTLTTLSQLVEEPLEYDYYITNDKSKVVSFDKYNHPIVLTDDEIFHNLKIYTTKLMNKLSNKQGANKINKKEFEKLTYCLELLAVNEIISDKKKLLKNKLFNCFSEEELNKFIEFAEKKKDLSKEIVKNLTGLNYNQAVKFAKENKENYIRLYNLHHANNHNSILYQLRGNFEEYLDIVEKVYKKEAKEIFESLVSE